MGSLLTKDLFSDYIAALDGYSVIAGGWVNHHWIQLGYQLASSVCGFLWSGGVSAIILLIMKYIPGLHLRVKEEDEALGIDETQLGEFAYDYVEILRDVNPGASSDSSSDVDKGVRHTEQQNGEKP